VSPDTVVVLRRKLLDNSLPLSARYRALYALRSASGAEVTESLIEALSVEKVHSALLRHDVAFCLGQRQDPLAVESLIALLKNNSEHPMVRHEAGEALGAIGTDICRAPLKEHCDDSCREVAETCQLAVQRMEQMQTASNSQAAGAGLDSPYASVDPTPAAPSCTPVAELRRTLLDENERMFDRYCAMFALRNKGGPDACKALAEAFSSGSALLKHEVAYVLGQMLDSAAAAALVDTLGDPSQHAMVRHEAAEALGAIAEPWTVELLKKFSADPEPIVADSCVVALDMLEHEASGAFEYADTEPAAGAEVSVAG